VLLIVARDTVAGECIGIPDALLANMDILAAL
jgi:hypothetical protein